MLSYFGQLDRNLMNAMKNSAAGASVVNVVLKRWTRARQELFPCCISCV